MREGNLPEWLANIPVGQEPREYAPVGNKGVTSPLDVLREAPSIPVGGTVGAMAIANKALGHKLAQFTENPGWLNLPSKPSLITRTHENQWEVRVGNEITMLTREELDGLLAPPDDSGNSSNIEKG